MGGEGTGGERMGGKERGGEEEGREGRGRERRGREGRGKEGRGKGRVSPSLPYVTNTTLVTDYSCAKCHRNSPGGLGSLLIKVLTRLLVVLWMTP